MMETVLLLLLLGTWGGIFWVYRRLSHDLDDVARDRVEQSEMQGNLTRMVGQLQQAADELAQAMSARTGKLQDLFDQADHRIAQLNDLTARLQEFGQMADALAHGYGNNGAGVRYADAAADAAALPEQASRPAESGDSAFEEVRRLADQGLSAAEIAQRTHRGREEVRLLLQLAQAAQPNEGTNA
jgi:hypothetical protein